MQEHCYSGNGCLDPQAELGVQVATPGGVPFWLCTACSVDRERAQAYAKAMHKLFAIGSALPPRFVAINHPALTLKALNAAFGGFQDWGQEPER